MSFNKMSNPAAILLSISFFFIFHNGEAQSIQQKDSSIFLADPTILFSKNIYYLYGTVEGGADSGFKVYTSTDKKLWQEKGSTLKRGDAFGESGFWAPQVFSFHHKFYMAYVANEQIALAESNSPLGPFTQSVKEPFQAPVKQIDPYTFMDEDGKKYLYHVRLQQGNRIFVAELKEDLSGIKPETLKECITATEPWENTQHTNWPVAEGPTVLKHKGWYYLFYSANDFRNPDYAVGYAVSKSPYGPWKKYIGNPVLSKQQTGQNGSGHGDFFTDKRGDLYYVFHTHYSNDSIRKRKTAIVKVQFKKMEGGIDEVMVEPGSFYYLIEKTVHPAAAKR